MEVRDTFENIERIIQENIRPVLRADGGDITLVDVKDGVVTIALKKGTTPVAFSKFLMTFRVRTGCSCEGSGCGCKGWGSEETQGGGA